MRESRIYCFIDLYMYYSAAYCKYKYTVVCSTHRPKAETHKHKRTVFCCVGFVWKRLIATTHSQHIDHRFLFGSHVCVGAHEARHFCTHLQRWTCTFFFWSRNSRSEMHRPNFHLFFTSVASVRLCLFSNKNAPDFRFALFLVYPIY